MTGGTSRCDPNAGGHANPRGSASSTEENPLTYTSYTNIIFTEQIPLIKSLSRFIHSQTVLLFISRQQILCIGQIGLRLPAIFRLVISFPMHEELQPAAVVAVAQDGPHLVLSAFRRLEDWLLHGGRPSMVWLQQRDVENRV
jgi:hypothetical protein